MKYFSLSIIYALIVTTCFSQSKTNESTIESAFLNPPKEARPLSYWFWMGSNFSKRGITKDFEAMKDMGVGGGIVTNLTSSVEESHMPTLNLPWPEQTYRSPAYWEALRFSASEAKRLGLEIGIHNAVGYSTTGGPWITEEKGMQRLIYSKIRVDGGRQITQKIPIPDLPLYNGRGATPNDKKASIYSDISVLAVPDSTNLTIKSVLDISNKMDKDGNLDWASPVGKWTVYRICYAPTMSKPHPVPEELFGKTLEVNKMDKKSNEFHWHSVIDPIKKNLGEYFGQSFNIMHVDSYESGNQNWTEAFKPEFIAMKGYDPTPWLVMGTVITNINKGNQNVVNSEAETKKFEWDFKDVVNNLYFKNGWEVAKKIINNSNLKFSWEPYYGPWSIAQGAAFADFPMGEFWATNKSKSANPQIPAAARAAGINVIGAEAFTCRPESSKWTETPATLKFSADYAFATGINRFVLHQWVHQPFDDKYQPGMDMGWWGTHFSRHQTWFEPGKAFIKYLTRTSSLLQFGEQVADVLYYEDLKNNNGDLISQDDFLKGKITVSNGNIVLPSGRSYKYMVFPTKTEMLPEVALKIKAIVASGATIVAPKPIESPSLQNAPTCNDVVKQIADEVWGNKPINKYGKGIIVTDVKAEGADNIASINLPKDVDIKDTSVSAATRLLHRRSKDTDLYFLVNSSQKEQHYTASFNITGKQPEFWQAEDGSTTDAPLWYEKDGRTFVSIKLKREQSVFVVFKKKASNNNHPISVSVKDTLNNWSVINDNNGKPAFCSSTSGAAEVVYSSGKKRTINTVAKSPMELNTDWNVSFAPKLDSVFKLSFPTLSDFSLSDNEQVKYFSGTATYTKNIQLNNTFIQANQRIKLDLGVMNNQLADITINGKKLGIIWYAPYIIDVTDYLQLGNNELKIAVTNTWANRIIADEKEPADFEWGAERPGMGQPMKAYPDWFIKNTPRPSKGRKTFSIWHYHKKDSKLLPSGLIGPVVLKREDMVAL